MRRPSRAQCRYLGTAGSGEPIASALPSLRILGENKWLPERRGTEVVVTGAPRKRLVAKSGTWVRIPPSPPAFAAFGGFGWASPVFSEPET